MVSLSDALPNQLSTATPIPVQSDNPHREFKWTTFAFGLAGLFACSVLVWQLATLNPTHWCALAKVTAPEGIAGCLTTLTKIINVKDHAIIGLVGIVGMTVLGLTAVALGVRLNLTVPGGGAAQVEVVNKEPVEVHDAKSDK